MKQCWQYVKKRAPAAYEKNIVGLAISDQNGYKKGDSLIVKAKSGVWRDAEVMDVLGTGELLLHYSR